MAQYELTSNSKEYRDVSLSFVPSPVTDDITLLRNERAINNSLKNIIMYIPGEVPFNYDVGSRTLDYMFDLVDEVTAGLLAQEIERAVLFCEPRVTFTPMDPYRLSTDQIRDHYDFRNSLETSRMTNGGDGALNSDNLGVFVNPLIDQNAFQVTIRYRIVGAEKIYRFQQLITPTR